MRNEGSMLVTLNFNGGALSCITYGPSQSLYSSLGYLLGEHLGASLMSGNRTRQQWPHWTSVPSAWLCAPNLPGLPFLLPPFLLDSEEVLFSASLASSLPLACSHCVAEYFLFILLSGGSCFKLYFTSSLVMAYNTRVF